MINRSIWNATKIKNNYQSLDRDLKVDILIIGGGITGINILYKLKDQDVCLVERNKIGSGITLNTTGKLTYLQDNYDKIMQRSYDNASLYLKSQIEAIEEIKKTIEENNINCDFTKTRSYLFARHRKNIKKLKQIKRLLNDHNIKVLEKNIPISHSKYAISVEDTYLFNPQKYLDGLASLIDSSKIYENTNVSDIKYIGQKYICKTSRNQIIAKTVILATHYPYFIYPYFFPLKASLEKSYIVAFKEKVDNLSLISIDKPIISIRNYQDNLFYLSETHSICSKVNDKKHFKEMLKLLKTKPRYVWSNTDIITNDYLPYIGYIQKNFILATGYNTWGMTNSMLSAIIVKDLIDQRQNKYVKLVDPKRHKFILRVVLDIFRTIKGYYEGLTNKNKCVKYSKTDGIDVIIYEEDNQKYIVKRKCPHAKCNLIFNEIEKTFDCPCHSSRFDLKGNAIKGPSKDNIRVVSDNLK